MRNRLILFEDPLSVRSIRICQYLDKSLVERCAVCEVAVLVEEAADLAADRRDVLWLGICDPLEQIADLVIAFAARQAERFILNVRLRNLSWRFAFASAVLRREPTRVRRCTGTWMFFFPFRIGACECFTAPFELHEQVFDLHLERRECVGQFWNAEMDSRNTRAAEIVFVKRRCHGGEARHYPVERGIDAEAET